jgi:hypothetical protein
VYTGAVDCHVHCSQHCELMRGLYRKKTHGMGENHASICAQDEDEGYKNSCGRLFPSLGLGRAGTV